MMRPPAAPLCQRPLACSRFISDAAQRPPYLHTKPNTARTHTDKDKEGTESKDGSQRVCTMSEGVQ